MRRTLPLLLGCLLLAGCGSSGGTSTGESSGASADHSPCPASSPAIKEAPHVASTDVDGDGKPDRVGLTGPSGDCTNVLFAQTGQAFLGVRLPRDLSRSGYSVDCLDGAIVLTRAVTHTPPGVLAAWDIRTTTYTFSGGRIASREKETADNVLPQDLGTKYPALVRHTMFASCRA